MPREATKNSHTKKTSRECLRRRNQTQHLLTSVVPAVKPSLPKMRLYSVLASANSGFTTTVPLSLNTNTKPSVTRTPSFFCPACYCEQHEEKVNELKSTIVEALRMELLQFKELICEVREKAGCLTPNCTASIIEKEHLTLTAIRSGTGELQKGSPVWKTLLPRKSSKPW